MHPALLVSFWHIRKHIYTTLYYLPHKVPGRADLQQQVRADMVSLYIPRFVELTKLIHMPFVQLIRPILSHWILRGNMSRWHIRLSYVLATRSLALADRVPSPALPLLQLGLAHVGLATASFPTRRRALQMNQQLADRLELYAMASARAFRPAREPSTLILVVC